MARRTRAQEVEILAAAISGSSACGVGVEVAVEEAFAHAEGGNRDLAWPTEADDLAEHDRAVGEERQARLGDDLNVLQGLRVDALDEVEEVEAVRRGEV